MVLFATLSAFCEAIIKQLAKERQVRLSSSSGLMDEDDVDVPAEFGTPDEELRLVDR